MSRKISAEWIHEGNSLRRSVTCATFMAAIDLVGRVAIAAEDMDHHPDIDIRWRTVTFVLSTHSAGTVTDLDFELAQRIDALIQSQN
jgi:4a-hydroxytetrahydrobiopterin dehydratase